MSCTSALDPAGQTFIDLVLEIFHVNGLSLEAGDDLLRPLGLTSARWQVLGALDKDSEPVANIARIMGLSRRAVQQTTDALVKDGFIEYRENPHHHRSKLVCLTPRAREALQAIALPRAAWANGAGQVYGSERLKNALELLRELSKDLEQEGVAAPRSNQEEKEVSR